MRTSELGGADAGRTIGRVLAPSRVQPANIPSSAPLLHPSENWITLAWLLVPWGDGYMDMDSFFYCTLCVLCKDNNLWWNEAGNPMSQWKPDKQTGDFIYPRCPSVAGSIPHFVFITQTFKSLAHCTALHHKRFFKRRHRGRIQSIKVINVADSHEKCISWSAQCASYASRQRCWYRISHDLY